MTGIIVADKNELHIDSLKHIKKTKVNQFEFNKYKINNKEVVIVHSGIGIANAAAATQILISKFKPKTIYNYGAVGAISNLNIYDIVSPKKIYYHDVFTPWYTRGQTPGENEYFNNSITTENNNNLASGSSFITKKSYLKSLKKEMGVDIIDMEGAAIAQICHKNNIKVVIIKCVSDIIGKNNNELENINDRISKAGKIAFDKVISLI